MKLLPAIALLGLAQVPLAAQEYSDATLTVGGKSIGPSALQPADARWQRTGGLLIAIEGSEVRALRAADRTAAWTAEDPDGNTLQWLAAGDDVLYLQQWLVRREPLGKGTILRVSLKDGKWRAPLRVDPNPAPADGDDEVIRSVLPLQAGVAVLSVRVKKGNDPHEKKISSYRIAHFTGSGDTPDWQRDIASAGEATSPGFVLLSPGGPRYARSDANPLSVAGSRLIVCAGAGEDILAYDLAKGELAWKLEAVWEFDRGFIGPSVWQHYLGRFGEEELRKDKNKVDPERRKALRERCRIVGGPVVVPYGESRRLFVAVAKSGGAGGGFVSDCVAYEIADDGVPVAILPLPRMILGNQFRVAADGVVWRCEKDALVKLAPSKQTRHIGMGPFGKSDCIGRVAWYFQPQEEDVEEDLWHRKPGPWLTTATAGDATFFDDRRMFRMASGGYVEKQGDKMFHFAIEKIEFPGGPSTTLTLNVPMAKEIQEPSTNFSKGERRVRSLVPYMIGVTALDYDEGELRVTLGQQGSATTLVFPLDR